MSPYSRLVCVVGLNKFVARGYLSPIPYRRGRMDANRRGLRSAGRTFSEAELEVVTDVVGNGGSHSRTQLMIRVCQRLQWYRPTGALKVRECRDLLATMERAGWFELPAKRGGRPLGSRTEVPVTPAGEPGQPLLGTVGQFGSVRLAVARQSG